MSRVAIRELACFGRMTSLMKQLVITYIRKNAVVKGKPNMPCHILPLVLPAFPGMLELIGDGFISSVSKCSQ